MIRRLLLTTASAVMLMALSSVARADTVTFSGGFGVTATVTNYSLNAAGNQFTFTVTNTSSSGSITAIGFNLTGIRPDYSLTARTNTNFTLANDVAANAGAQNITSSFDFALITKNGFNGGDVSEGIWVGVQANPGQNTATFTVAGDFTGMSADAIARAIVLRFQGIGPRDESTIGTANPNAPVPEPMTMLLLGTGLAGVAAKVRRQRRKE